MRVETKKHLHDISQAADLITRFVSARNLADFENDAMLRSAVERQFEIIGEALAQLARLDAGSAERITESKRIIGFRNILIHGYAEVDPRMVWDIIETKLPRTCFTTGQGVAIHLGLSTTKRTKDTKGSSTSVPRAVRSLEMRGQPAPAVVSHPRCASGM